MYVRIGLRPHWTLGISEVWTYDDDGNLTSFDINTTIPQERYIKMLSKYEAFDDKDNWTLMFKSFESLPTKEFIERQIEYYE